MQIIKGIHLVASGWLGCSLTDPHDCHVYLLAGSGGAVLIDAGCGLDSDAIVDNIARAGVDPTRVTHILLTHAHADHAAGAAALSSRLGAQVWASAETAAILRDADENAAGLVAARAVGVYPASVHLVPTTIAKELGVEAIDVAGFRIDCIPTPGHAAGHLCFSVRTAGRNVLFAGDLVFSRGRVAVLDTPDTDLGQLHTSLRAALATMPDLLLAGHGSMVLDHAGEHIATALEAFERGDIPAALVS
ncbi:MAG TPA: MBL fold metallo-hydrolase [Ilumatobacteraceae bacterium]|nr:MBL fold metallo-hydrolase [Ilumatobacteraceae bacterium]HRB01917.1 MBL fold metallo-hydrolase [Ilumatobacteraceae bacterium]